MTKKDLFDWANKNNDKYPALNQLRETIIDDIEFIELPVQYGIYRGTYFCEHNNPLVYKLRKEGYAVGVISDYETIKTCILECVSKLKNKKA
jgi:hypothetical protein